MSYMTGFKFLFVIDTVSTLILGFLLYDFVSLWDVLFILGGCLIFGLTVQF
jgi:hypothetical protein